MDIQFQNNSQWNADCVLLFLFQGEDLEGTSPNLWYSRPWLDKSPARQDFRGKKNQLALIYSDDGSPIRLVLAVGMGKRDGFTLNDFRASVAKATAYAREKGCVSLGIVTESLDPIAETLATSREELITESVCASLLSLYRLDAYRSKPDEDAPANPSWLAFLCPEKDVPQSVRSAANRGVAEAKGVLLARDLANGPANIITPTALAAKARIIADAYGFSCTVFGSEEIRAMEMNALWAVAKGSKEEPRFIILEHCPKGQEHADPIILVGKGITFDTGGISLKPAAKMHEMKGDMGGGAAVLGFFEALGNMEDAAKVPRVIGLIPTTENMPGGFATRPGDVVTTFSGKTVEILNTDAEGRLILCDALSYAQKNWKPKILVDVATLTGACVVALGDDATGLFTNDSQLRKLFLDSAEKTGDLLWPLPMWKEYDANIKSDIADVANVGPREGGAIHAALFLKRFIEKETRWVHLDIAGAGYVVKTNPLHPLPGATGMGVRLFCRLVQSLS